VADRPHVVIIGGGFGGLEAARRLRGVRVTLIDRTNHHLFQPLLYQVAMAGLSPADIAAPIRRVLRGHPDVAVMLGEVTAIDVPGRRVQVDESDGERAWIAFDYLVVAAGARTSWFGHPEWEKAAVGLKDLDDAVEVRRRVLLAFEAAELEPDADRRRALLTFVVIGGGPTGVEVAGALAELERFVLARDFHRLKKGDAHVVLLEAGQRLLSAFPERLSEYAEARLRALGVEVRKGQRVTDIGPEGVVVGGERLPAATVVWGAGVEASPLGAQLPAERDRAGRVLVAPDCSLPGHPEVFVIGDLAAYVHQGGQPLPGVSPVALQQARYVARCIGADLKKRPRPAFRYLDKGSMATIGRSAAIAQIGRLRFTGLFAWLVWLAVHIFFLIGFRNRLMVMLNWAWSYLTYERGARLITGHRLHPGPPEGSVDRGAGVDGGTVPGGPAGRPLPVGTTSSPPPRRG
jgi:NADH dehydrogenase